MYLAGVRKGLWNDVGVELERIWKGGVTDGKEMTRWKESGVKSY